MSYCVYSGTGSALLTVAGGCRPPLCRHRTTHSAVGPRSQVSRDTRRALAPRATARETCCCYRSLLLHNSAVLLVLIVGPGLDWWQAQQSGQQRTAGGRTAEGGRSTGNWLGTRPSLQQVFWLNSAQCLKYNSNYKYFRPAVGSRQTNPYLGDVKIETLLNAMTI